MAKILIWTFFLLYYSHCIKSANFLETEIFIYHNETSFKAEFAFQVVEKIFNAFKQWFFTITFCEFTYFENRILKYTENYAYGYPVMLLNGCPDMNKTKVKPKINKHGQTAYVVTSEELSTDESEFSVEALLRTGVFKPRSAVIFVINTPVKMDSYFYFAMKSHFRLLCTRSLTNSVILVWSGELRMFTYNPFSDEVKDITYVSDVSSLLARQYDDLFGSELRLSVFRKIYTSDETGPVHCDSNLAKTVMWYLNATCKPLPPRDGNTVGDMLEDGTVTGVTADLIDGYTDLELNSRILKNSYYGYIDTTYPLQQDELCFMIKKSIKQSTFMTTLKLISSNMLILFMFNVVFLIAFSLYVRKVEMKVWDIDDNRTNSETMLDLLKCFIRQTVDFKFSGPLFRCITLMIMLYSLVVDCAIDGIITSAIAYVRYKPDISTLTELVQTNLTFGVHNRHVRIFQRSLSVENRDKVIERMEVLNDIRIKEIIEKRQFHYALLLRKSDALYISRKQSNMKDGRPIFHTVEECPVPCSIVYELRYGSPYLTRLNNLLHHLNQGGILQYWTKSDEFTLFEGRKKAIYNGDNKDRKALNTKNLKEMFIVLMIGLAISTSLFILECAIYIFNKYRRYFQKESVKKIYKKSKVKLEKLLSK